jgi:hypothetical protein
MKLSFLACVPLIKAAAVGEFIIGTREREGLLFGSAQT